MKKFTYLVLLRGFLLLAVILLSAGPLTAKPPSAQAAAQGVVSTADDQFQFENLTIASGTTQEILITIEQNAFIVAPKNGNVSLNFRNFSGGQNIATNSLPIEAGESFSLGLTRLAKTYMVLTGTDGVADVRVIFTGRDNNAIHNNGVSKGWE